MFDPKKGYFKELSDKSLYFASNFKQEMSRLKMFKFIGKITAKAIYE